MQNHVLGSNYKWYLVGMLWLICLLNYADRVSIFSLFPLLQREMRLTPVQLGLMDLPSPGFMV